MAGSASNPWRIELLVVRDESHSGAERRALSRDVQRGLLMRLRRGTYVERAAFIQLSLEEQHIVRMRALAAVSWEPVVFSHWSAAVLHRLPVIASRLRTPHTTVTERRERGRDGVSGHLFAVKASESQQIGPLVATSPGRTVVDVAGGAPFEEGVMAADAALLAGGSRAVLEAAVDLAGPRQADRRIDAVIAFAHPGAESAAESRSRCTMYRIGFEPPELQHRMALADGSAAFLDFRFRAVNVGGEVDGAKKYLDPRFAPAGAGRAVYEEKMREDEVRAGLAGLARWGWAQAGNTAALRAVLARVGVHPPASRATLADYAADARASRARFTPRRPLVQP